MERAIGLFGGSFNPPHVGHTLATLWALQTGALDEVWWMPTYRHAFGKQLVGFEQRVALCELATRDLRRVHILEIERELGGLSRTIDTVIELERRHPGARFTLIVGSDILAERHAWKDWEGLMRRVDLHVIGRAGHTEALKAYRTAERRPRRDSPLPEVILPEVSSTHVRELLAKAPEDEALRAWLDAAVLEAIQRAGFYATSEEPS